MSATVLILFVGVLAGAGLGVLLAQRLNVRANDAMREEMRNSFAALSQDALRNSNATLLQTADQTLRARQDAITEMLRPVRETLDKVQAQVVRADRDREGSFTAVKEQLASLTQTQELLRRSADGLSTALKSPNMRGKWGEMQLKRIVELAGMLEHCSFEQQVTSATDARLRPDMTIVLPGNAAVVVDSKVPIDAYMKAVEAKDDADRQRHMDAHVTALRSHIKTLGGKKYWEQFGDSSPEFVVLFLPLEPLMHAAFERDADLLEFAAGERVVLATPMTLLALLRAVASGWQQHSLAKNAEEIRQVGQELCERLMKMLEHFDEAGGDLKTAVESFNRAVSSFDARVMPSVRRFQELKVPGAEKIEAPKPRPAEIRAFRTPLLELADTHDEPASPRPVGKSN